MIVRNARFQGYPYTRQEQTPAQVAGFRLTTQQLGTRADLEKTMDRLRGIKGGAMTIPSKRTPNALRTNSENRLWPGSLQARNG
jgi:hypothetical protein